MPYFSLVRGLFFSVVVLFPVIDLAMAFLYHASGAPEVGAIRYYRDGVCLFLAGLGFMSRHLPFQLRLSAGMYGLLLGIYTLVSLAAQQLPMAVVIGSLGTLIIPVSLTLAGFAAVREAQDMQWLIRLLMVIAVASALFGIWEVQHTDFWTEDVGLGNYIRDVKGVTNGFQPDVFLPWNFSGYQGARRAAGLLAAPLAEGFFLAVVGLVAFAYLRGRSLALAGMVSALCAYGVQMSGTRGAVLALVIGCLGYFLYPSAHRSAQRTNRIIIGVLALVSLPALTYEFLYTVRLQDQSTVGHVDALARNVAGLDRVVLFGFGVGAAGATASAASLDIEGGGEGAFFSIAYQLGLPGAAVFLWFFLQLVREVVALRFQPGTNGELARALLFLSIGVAASMFSSEHILTFSGMGAFWFLTGGYLGYQSRQAAREQEGIVIPKDPA